MTHWLTLEFLGFVFGVTAINFLAAMSPGPDTLLVIRLALRYGLVKAIYSAVGIGLGIGVHMVILLSGLTYVMVNMPVVLQIIGVLGGLYLTYLGITIFRDTSGINISDVHDESDFNNEQGTSIHNTLEQKPLILGFWTNVLNPKAFIFFLGVMSPLVQANSIVLENTEAMLFLVGCVCVSVTAWFVLLSYGASRPMFVSVLSRYGIWVNRLTGFVFLFYAGIMVYNAFMA